MRYLLLCTLFLIISCSKENVLDVTCSEQDCELLKPVGLSIESIDNAVLLSFGAGGFIDGPGNACAPDAYDIYISEDRINFEKITRAEADESPYLFEGLENGQLISFKVVGIHCELDSQTSQVVTVMVGAVPLPQIIDNPMTPPLNQFEDFRLAPDGDRFIYRTSSDRWYHSSFSNPVKGNQVFFDAFYAEWNPFDGNEITAIEKTDVQILPSLNGTTSKSLDTYNMESQSRQTIHEIDKPWDFNNDVHNPERYWIHEFQYSLDGKSIYFVSNKDNGSLTVQDHKVYENLWRLNLVTKEIEAITDFLPDNFDLTDFVEDPDRNGSFYVIGGPYDEKVEIDDVVYYMDKVGIYYYNAMDNTLSLVLDNNDEMNNLSIDPIGQNLVFSSYMSGKSELWSYNISSKEIKQITRSTAYRPSYKWHYLNWISDTEFMTYVRHDEILKFGIFSI